MQKEDYILAKSEFTAQIKNHIDEMVSQYQKMNKSIIEKNIVFSGSSLTEFFPLTDLCKKYDVKSKIYNRGIAGLELDGLIENVDSCIYDLNPRILVLNIGSNDFSHVNFNSEIHIQKYVDFIDLIKGRLPDCKICVMGYYPINEKIVAEKIANNIPDILVNRNNTTIKLVNLNMEHLGDSHGFYFLDVGDILRDKDSQLSEQFTIDGIHLNNIAYEKIFRHIMPDILKGNI